MFTLGVSIGKKYIYHGSHLSCDLHSGVLITPIGNLDYASSAKIIKEYIIFDVTLHDG